MALNFSFGICTRAENVNSPLVNSVVQSIIDVCPRGCYDIQINASDETLTKKKNDLVRNAKFENVVLLHDYFGFKRGWYEAWKGFPDWQIASCSQLLLNGNRHFTDWVSWDDPEYGRYFALPYDDWTRTRFQYLSGGFFLVKRSVIFEEPMNESLDWGSAEDVEWSLRVREKYDIKCNGKAVVQHLRNHRDNY